MPGPTTQKSPFGVMLTAMVTPFTADGSLDLDGTQRLAAHLVDDLRHDGLVINGTTGESATKTDEEDLAVLRAVLEAVGDRATVIAGVGTQRHGALGGGRAGRGARGRARRHGGHPLLQPATAGGLVRHFHAIADATDLPMLTVRHPEAHGHRRSSSRRMIRIAEHPRIVAEQGRQGRPRVRPVGNGRDRARLVLAATTS